MEEQKNLNASSELLTLVIMKDKLNYSINYILNYKHIHYER